MPCLPAMRSEPKIGRCSHPSSPRAGSTTSTPSPTSPKPSRLSSTVTHKARSKTSCPGDSERRQPRVLRGSSKRLQSERLFDQLVGKAPQIWRHAYPEPLCRLEIDHERELAGLLDRQVAGLCALNDFGSINTSASETI